MINVKFKIDEVLKGLSKIEREAVPRAARAAIGKAATAVRKETEQRLIGEMGLAKKKEVKGLIKVVKRPSAKSLTAIVSTTNARKGIGLEHTGLVNRTFGYWGTRRITTSVSYKGKKLRGAFGIPHGLRNGGLKNAVFRRTGGKFKNGRPEVQRLLAYPVVQELFHSKLDKRQSEIAAKEFDELWRSELQKELKKIKMA